MTTFFPKPLDKQVAAISDSVSQTQDGLAIVANGNNHAAISSGQFVYVKNHDTLAEGLYKATASISANGSLSTSNLTADGTGGLNDLQGQVTALNSNSIKSKTISVTTNANGNVDTHIGGIVRAFATDSEHSSNCVAVPYTSAGIVRIFDNTFTPIANASVTLKVYYVAF